MYVKLFQQILDSSIAGDRKLRHFFIDLLLCCDSKGYIMMTKSAISRRIGSSIEEVEWGISELLKPDSESKTPDHKGARIEPVEGSGYGWRVLNYEHYRALQDADQLRESNRIRVQRYRDRQKEDRPVMVGNDCNDAGNACNPITEGDAEAEGDVKERETHTRRFNKPSATEVVEYAKTIGFSVDGERFLAYYDAADWMRGKSKIKDWKACVRTWKATQDKGKANRQPAPTVSGPAEDPFPINQEGEFK